MRIVMRHLVQLLSFCDDCLNPPVPNAVYSNTEKKTHLRDVIKKEAKVNCVPDKNHFSLYCNLSH